MAAIAVLPAARFSLFGWWGGGRGTRREKAPRTSVCGHAYAPPICAHHVASGGYSGRDGIMLTERNSRRSLPQLAAAAAAAAAAVAAEAVLGQAVVIQQP